MPINASDGLTRSIARVARDVIAEGMREELRPSSEPDHQGEAVGDYESLSRMAEMASRVADSVQTVELFRKAAQLHQDAANESGSSASDRLFSDRELSHLADARYYSARAEGMTDHQAQESSSSYVKELSLIHI